MQLAVSNFIKERENGLCLIDMPTGTGKTYQTRKFIKNFLKEKKHKDVDCDLIIYLTPLRKNVDDIYNELKDDFKDDLELFENNALRIYSNYECVLENFLNEDIQNKISSELKRKESFKQLRDKISEYKYLEANTDCFYSGLTTSLKEIRTLYEPNFRKDLEKELNKKYRKKEQRIRALNHEYEWVKILYPSCLTSSKKVLFMTMDKFLVSNDPIIDKSYKFISYLFDKNALVFIDEFDATKNVILNQEIEKCVDYKIDLYKLFSGIVTVLKAKQEPESLFANSDISRKAFENMKEKMLSVEKEYNLDYIFKLEKKDESERYFLFDDYSIHTITNGNKRNYINVDADKKKKQNTIYLSSKNNDGIFERTIYGIKGVINYFIGCCRIMAYEYFNEYNKKAKFIGNENMQIDQAVSTIVDYFDLDSKLAETLETLIISDLTLTKSKKTKELQNKGNDIFSTDFYMNGFKYYDFADDIAHDVSTSIEMSYLNSTPEKFIISLCSEAKVVGLSATASIPTVTGNYNLEYIKDKLGSDYFQISETDFARIKYNVENQLNGDYIINTNKTPFKGNEETNIIAESLFNTSSLKEKYESKFEQYKTDSKNSNYDNIRLGKVLWAIKDFVKKQNSKVMLVLTNRNIKASNSESFSTHFISEFIADVCKELKVHNNVKFHCLFGNEFEKEKEKYQEEVKQNNKVILFSSYPSVGTGQNLQYELLNENEIKEQKDIDSIYIEYPTNRIVHHSSLKEEGNLNKYIYQIEALKMNGEITPKQAMLDIQNAFKQYMNIGLTLPADGKLYNKESINNDAVKVLVQAVGRICRTKNKSSSHEVNIYIDNEIMDKIDFSFMKDRLMNREFKQIVRMSELKPSVKEYPYINRAMDCNARVRNRLSNVLSENKTSWSEDSMNQWKWIRKTVLQYPTISLEKLNELAYSKEGLESIKDFYFIGDEDMLFSTYTYKRDENEGAIISYFKGVKPGDIVVSDKNSRLIELLKNEAVKKRFIENNYALEFKPRRCIILPIVYENIYKGALGEEAGRAILESEGILLEEIKEGDKFEKFDFVLKDNKNVYIDFKNWSLNNIVSSNDEIEKIENKLEKVRG